MRMMRAQIVYCILLIFLCGCSTKETKDVSHAPAFKYSVSSTADAMEFGDKCLYDNNPQSAWSSKAHEKPDVSEWVTIEQKNALWTVEGFMLTPRVYDRGVQAFPVDFRFESSPDNRTWTNLLTKTDYSRPQPMKDDQGAFLNGALEIYFQVPASKVRFYRMKVTKAGKDDHGGYSVQLSELKVITRALQTTRFQSIQFEKKCYLAKEECYPRSKSPLDCGDDMLCLLRAYTCPQIQGYWNCGDSWMMSVSAEGKIYSSSSDGAWKTDSDYGCHPFNASYASSLLYEIAGSPQDICRAATPAKPQAESHPNFKFVSSNLLQLVTPANPENWTPTRSGSSGVSPGGWGAHFVVDTFFLGNTLYVGIVGFGDLGKVSTIGVSEDLGKTLLYDAKKPMWDGSKHKSFGHPMFLQNGKGYSGNTDGYIYIYGTQGCWGKTNVLSLARVPAAGDPKHLLNVEAYEYFSNGNWVKDINQASDVLLDGNNVGGMGSVMYNPKARRYFYITFAEPEYDQDLTNKNPRMVLYDAPNPWGPWYRTGIIGKEDALFELNTPYRRDALYNPSFNTEWIEDDGSMWISYSNNRPFYSFHLGLIKLLSSDQDPQVIQVIK